MNALTRYLLGVLVLTLLVQVVFTALVVQLAAPKTVDTYRAGKTIFQTDAKMAVYASPLIAKESRQPQVVILGSSNTVLGLRPDRLQPYIRDVSIHNLAAGTRQFRSVGQLIDLLYRQTPAQNRHNYVFVIGISYPLIINTPEEQHKLRTVTDDELQRFGLFTQAVDGSKARVGDRWLAHALQATWPFLVPKALYNTCIRVVPEPYWLGLAEPVYFSPEESDSIQYSHKQNQERIDYYNSRILDTTGEFMFDPLMRAIEHATAAGARVVVVDLPTAKWLQQATIHYAAYQKLRAPYISRLEKMPHVRYVNAEQGFVDDDFYDGIHPRYRATAELARQVAPAITKALKDDQ